jgi:hypothetical protein
MQEFEKMEDFVQLLVVAGQMLGDCATISGHDDGVARRVRDIHVLLELAQADFSHHNRRDSGDTPIFAEWLSRSRVSFW